MKTLRTALALVTVGLLTVGYFVSQYAYFNGWAADYAARVDVPPVSRLALVIFLAIVVLGFVKERGMDDQ